MDTHSIRNILVKLESSPYQERIELFWKLINVLSDSDFYSTPLKAYDYLIPSVFLPIMDYGLSDEQLETFVSAVTALYVFIQQEDVKAKLKSRGRGKVIRIIGIAFRELHILSGDILLSSGQFQEALERYCIAYTTQPSHKGSNLMDYGPDSSSYSEQIDRFISFLDINDLPHGIADRIKKLREDSVGTVKFLTWDKNRRGYILSLKAKAKPLPIQSQSCCSWEARLHEIMGEGFQESEGAAFQAISGFLIREGYEFGLAAERYYEIAVPQNVELIGKSGGLPMAIGQISSITMTPVPLNMAVTGVIDAEGKVKPVDGLKHKLEAAESDVRISKVLIPKDNLAEANLYAKGLELCAVDNLKQAVDSIFPNEHVWEKLKSKTQSVRLSYYEDDIVKPAKRTNRFVGRKQMLKDIEDAIPEHDTIIVKGSPGVGKTSIMERLAEQHKYVYYALSKQIRHTTNPREFVKSIYYELICGCGFRDGSPDFSNPQKVLCELLGKTDQFLSNTGEKAVIVIDGLDEGQESLIHELIPLHPFSNITFVFSSRPARFLERLTINRKAKIVDFGDQPAGLLEYDAKLIIDSLLESELKAKLVEEDYDRIFVKSDGNPQYLEYLCRAANSNPGLLQQLDGLPQGLDKWYETDLNLLKGKTASKQRYYQDYIVPVIGLLAVIREPVPEPFIMSVLASSKMKKERISKALDKVYQYCRPEKKDGVIYISVNASGFVDYVEQCEDFDLPKCHLRISEYYGYGEKLLRCEPDHSGADFNTVYGFKHLSHHLTGAKEYEKLVGLIESGYISAKCSFFKSHNVVMDDFSLIERECVKKEDYDSLLKCFLAEIHLKEKTLRGISVKGIAALAGQGNWSIALDMVDFIAEDTVRVLAVGTLASVAALQGDHERKERLIQQVDEITEQCTGIDYIRLARCIPLADYRKAFRYLTALPHIQEKDRLRKLLKDEDVGKAFTHIIMILFEYDEEICKEAILYLFDLLSEDDEFFSGLNDPYHEWPIWFRQICSYLLPVYISRMDLEFLRVLSRNSGSFFSSTFFEALQKGSDYLSLADQIEFLNTLFEYRGEEVINTVWVEKALPLFGKLYENHESVINQLKPESLQDAFIYGAVIKTRLSLEQKEGLASKLTNNGLRCKALVSLYNSHPEMESAMRRRIVHSIGTHIAASDNKADFPGVLEIMSDWYMTNSENEIQALEKVWDLAQANPELRHHALGILLHRNLELALDKLCELTFSKDVIQQLVAYLKGNWQNLVPKHRERIQDLVQNGLNMLDGNSDDYKLKYRNLLEAWAYLDLETAWETVVLSDDKYDSSFLSIFTELAAQQGNERVLAGVFEQAGEIDAILHTYTHVPIIVGVLERYAQDRALKFIEDLDSEIMRGECLIWIARRYFRERKIDCAWQFISMVKQSSNPYPSIETAYHYEDTDKEAYFGGMLLIGDQLEEMVRAIHNSSIPDKAKTILTDHYLCGIFRPEIAWRLAKQYIPDHPFAYDNRQFQPIYFHLAKREGLEKAYSYIEEGRVAYSVEMEYRDFLFWCMLVNGSLTEEDFPKVFEYEDSLSPWELDTFARAIAEMLAYRKKPDSSIILQLLGEEELSQYHVPVAKSMLHQNQPLSGADMEVLASLAALLAEEDYDEFFYSAITKRPISESVAKNLINAALTQDFPVSLCETLIHACWEKEPVLSLEVIKQTLMHTYVNPGINIIFLSKTSHTREAKEAFYLFLAALERDYDQLLSVSSPIGILAQLCDAAKHILNSDELEAFISVLEDFCNKTPPGQEKDRLLDLTAGMIIPIDLDRGYELMESIEDKSHSYSSVATLAGNNKSRLMSFIKQHIMVEGSYVFQNIHIFRHAIEEADLSAEELMALNEECDFWSILEMDQTFLGEKAVEKLASTDLGAARDYVNQGRKQLYPALIEPMVKVSRIDRLVSIFEDYLEQQKSRGKHVSEETNDRFYLRIIANLSDKQLRMIPELLDRIIQPSNRSEASIHYLKRANPIRADEFKRMYELSINEAQIHGVRRTDFLAIMEIGLEKLPLSYATMKMIETKSLGSLSPEVLSLWMCKAFHDKDFRSLLELLKTKTEEIYRKIQ